MKKRHIVICLTLILLEACYAPPRMPQGTVVSGTQKTAGLVFYEKGLASWYGKDFDGRPTASGEIYDMYKISAAHKTLPLGTHVLVRNERNGRTLEVVINDRGPFVHGRIIDLSYGAARELGSVDEGVVPVSLFLFSRVKENCLSVQIGAFAVEENAKRYAITLSRQTHEKARIVRRGGLFKVLLGRFPTEKKAREFGDSTGVDFFVVSCD